MVWNEEKCICVGAILYADLHSVRCKRWLLLIFEKWSWWKFFILWDYVFWKITKNSCISVNMKVSSWKKEIAVTRQIASDAFERGIFIIDKIKKIKEFLKKPFYVSKIIWKLRFQSLINEDREKKSCNELQYWKKKDDHFFSLSSTFEFWSVESVNKGRENFETTRELFAIVISKNEKIIHFHRAFRTKRCMKRIINLCMDS